MRESLYNELRVLPTLSALIEVDGTVEGSAVHLNHNGNQFRTVLLTVHSGTLTDGTFTVSVEESANGTTGWTEIPAERLEGAAPVPEADENDTVWGVGVLPNPGAKPYLRAKVVAADLTDGGYLSAAFVLGSPNNTPVERA